MSVSGADMAAQDRRWLTAAAVGTVLVLGAAWLWMPPVAVPQPFPSSYSPLPTGALAAVRLLRRSGYRVQRWRLPLTVLPNGGGAVLVLADPLLAPAAETAAGRRDWAALRQFMAAGGTVLATGWAGARLTPDYGGKMARGGGVGKYRPLAPGAAAAAGPIWLRPQWTWPRSGRHGVTLYGDARRAVVVAAPVGKGRLVLWASATPLTNDGLRRAGNLALLLAAVGPAPRRVLWDEYFHGVRQSWAGFLGTGRLPWLALPLGLLLLAALASHGRRWGPEVVAPDAARDSPLEFTAAVGNLYERASAGIMAVEIVRHAALRKAPGLDPPPSPPGGGPATEAAALEEYRWWARQLAGVAPQEQRRR